MKAEEALLEKLLSQHIHFSIPIYQRRYEWRSNEWDRFWDDVIEQSTNENRVRNLPVFFGAIGLKSIEDKGGNVKYDIIDGQQRITTVVLFLAAIRDRYFHDSEITNVVNKLLKLDYNEYKRDEHKKRLNLAYQDDTCLKSIIMELKLPTDVNNNVIDCYRHFKSKFENIHNPKILIATILKGFQIVWITIEENDNAPKIFETLNSVGTRLEQIDHIRIHILTYIDEKTEQDFYFKYWKQIEDYFSLSIREFPKFVRYFLMKDGIIIKKEEHLFLYLKEYFKCIPKEERGRFLENFLSSMLKSAEIFYKISTIANTNTFSEKINYRLKRLNMIPGKQYYPVLLHIFEYYSCSSKELVNELIEITLRLIETLYIRRYICADGEYGIDIIFSDLCKILPTSMDSSTLDVIKEFFSYKIPNDDSFKAKLPKKSIFSNEKRSICQLILCSIEEEISERAVKFSYDPSDIKLSIEHIMPQKPERSPWEGYLIRKMGLNWKDSHLLYCHTIGNLTLATPEFNSILARKLFHKKAEKMTKCCGYNLNTYFEKISDWTEVEIQQRSEYLTSYCLKIWPPGKVIPPPPVTTGDTPVSITIKGTGYKVTSWLKLYQLTIYLITKYSSDKFRDLVNNHPDFFALEAGKLEKEEKIKETSIYYRQVRGPDDVYIQSKIFLDEIGWTSDDWHGIAVDKEKKIKEFS